jgi:hypothetical protein
MKKKAQAATEYLIILAVVVIIALIVVGVIGGFPGMTRGISERDSASYWATADVGITRYYLHHTALLTQLVVRNNKIFQINVTNITFDGANSVNLANGVVISPGSATAINMTLSACGATGDSVTKNVVISYKDPTYGTSYTFTGEKPLVGTCQ